MNRILGLQVLLDANRRWGPKVAPCLWVLPPSGEARHEMVACMLLLPKAGLFQAFWRDRVHTFNTGSAPLWRHPKIGPAMQTLHCALPLLCYQNLTGNCLQQHNPVVKHEDPTQLENEKLWRTSHLQGKSCQLVSNMMHGFRCVPNANFRKEG